MLVKSFPFLFVIWNKKPLTSTSFDFFFWGGRTTSSSSSSRAFPPVPAVDPVLPLPIRSSLSHPTSCSPTLPVSVPPFLSVLSLVCPLEHSSSEWKIWGNSHSLPGCTRQDSTGLEHVYFLGRDESEILYSQFVKWPTRSE